MQLAHSLSQVAIWLGKDDIIEIRIGLYFKSEIKILTFVKTRGRIFRNLTNQILDDVTTNQSNAIFPIR